MEALNTKSLDLAYKRHKTIDFVEWEWRYFSKCFADPPAQKKGTVTLRVNRLDGSKESCKVTTVKSSLQFTTTDDILMLQTIRGSTITVSTYIGFPILVNIRPTLHFFHKNTINRRFDSCHSRERFIYPFFLRMWCDVMSCSFHSSFNSLSPGRIPAALDTNGFIKVILLTWSSPRWANPISKPYPGWLVPDGISDMVRNHRFLTGRIIWKLFCKDFILCWSVWGQKAVGFVVALMRSPTVDQAVF
jgi:hypothetical protein